MLETLPENLKTALSGYVKPDTESEEYALMKAADRLAAYVKCLEELRCGNGEFIKAKNSIENDLKSRRIPAVDYFLENFIPAFSLTLDELEDME